MELLVIIGIIFVLIVYFQPGKKSTRSSRGSAPISLDPELSRLLLRSDDEDEVRRSERVLSKNATRIRGRLDELGGTPVAISCAYGETAIITNRHMVKLGPLGALDLLNVGETSIRGIGGRYTVFAVSSDYSVNRPFDGGVLLHIEFPSLAEAHRFCRILDTQIENATADPTRTIPALYPDYYAGILSEVRKPGTGQNGAALTELVSQMLSVNALMWFDQYDPAARDRWWSQFRHGGPEDRVIHLVDDMVDFLVAWSPDMQGAVDRTLKEIRAQLVAPDSQLRRYQGELPFGMWSRQQIV